MDVNAKSPLVWKFYEATLKQLKAYGCSILRLDAFAYLHKAVGESNFFNEPGTWDYLSRIKEIADRHQLILLPDRLKIPCSLLAPEQGRASPLCSQVRLIPQTL